MNPKINSATINSITGADASTANAGNADSSGTGALPRKSVGQSLAAINKRHVIREFTKDLVSQSWTLVGLLIAYFVLEGSAKELTGNLIILTSAVWVLTFPIRYNKHSHDQSSLKQKK